MKFVVIVGLALVAGASISTANDEQAHADRDFYKELTRQVQRQHQVLMDNGLPGMAAKFIDDLREMGSNFVSMLREAMASAGHAMGLARDSEGQQQEEENKHFIDSLAEMIDHDLAALNSTRRAKRDTGGLSSLIASMLGDALKTDRKGGSSADSSDASSDQDQQQSQADASSQQQSEDVTSSVSGTAQTRIGNPAPVILIPGPPGKPGLPGPPGLPGKPGKIPNFRGLKAILTTRVAELLAFLALIFVLMIAKFLGLLGLLLGLVLPIYGKLKNAGVLVPGEEKGYGEPAPSYGAPAPAYGPPPSDAYAGRRKRAIPMQFPYPMNGLAQRVHSGIEAAQQNHVAPF